MDLSYRHPLYEHYIDRWTQYAASYRGGEDYRTPQLGMLRKYLFEDDAPGEQYANRLAYTAMDNLTKLTVDTYRSFLFRNKPIRTLGNLKDNIAVNRFLEDIDFDGQDLDDFMKEANDMAMIYGQVWILVTKGFVNGIGTREQENELDIRPYARMFTPENVCDWDYTTQINGSERLTYVKTKEWLGPNTIKYITWTPEEIATYIVEEDDQGNETITMTELQTNSIGRVPFVILKANPSQHRGIGLSDVADVVSIQKSIFNLFSEAEQGIRVSNHPTLVKPHDVSATSGAGSVINLDNQMDPQLKPYLIEPGGTNIDSIINIVNLQVEAFLRSTHLGAIMAARGLSVKSGIALATEFQQLNTRLGDKAAKLEAAEWGIWSLFLAWSGLEPNADFNIEYHKSFDLRDEHADLKLYSEALAMGISSDTFTKELYKQIAKVVIEDGDALDIIYQEIEKGKLGVIDALPQEDQD
jgi:hypothetical protein